MEQRLGELGVAAHGRGVACGPVGIHGLSGIPPWKKGMFGLSEEELAAALESGYAQVAGGVRHVLLAHVPPHGMTLDRTFSGVHAGRRPCGSSSIERHPALVLCGHIHEGRGIEKLGPTTVVNCGHGSVGEHAVVEIAASGKEPRVELRKVQVAAE